MLLVRRRAPEGSYFQDGDRASGVFGVLATGFSVLLGFIIFLTFTSYDQSRTGAEAEALVVAQQVETAQFLPAATGGRSDRRACLLRALRRERRVGANGGRDARRCAQSLGSRDVSHAAGRRAGKRERAVRLRQVARADVGSRGGPPRPDPRGGRRHPDRRSGSSSSSSPSSSSCTCSSSRTAARAR